MACKKIEAAFFLWSSDNPLSHSAWTISVSLDHARSTLKRMSMVFKYHITVTSPFVSFDCFGKSRLEYRLLYCVVKSPVTLTIHLRESKSTQVVSASSYNTTGRKKRDNTIKQ